MEDPITHKTAASSRRVIHVQEVPTRTMRPVVNFDT